MRWLGVVAVLCTACAGGAHVASVAPPRPAAPRRAAVVPSAPPPTTVAPTTTAAPIATPLSRALDQVLFNTNSCVLVTDDAATTVLYAHNADVPMAPASTQKLLIAAAALALLGPDYRFQTTVVSAAPPVAGRVPAAWLVGGGDPLLVTAPYAARLASSPVTRAYVPTLIDGLAGALHADGVTGIAALHGDDTRYVRQPFLPSWPADLNQGEFDIGPLSGLELDQGLEHWGPAQLSADPARHAADVLAQIANGTGIATTAAGDAAAPARPVVLARVTSAPLASIVTAMLQASDNQIAELIVREIDRHAGGTGTTAGGLRRIVAADAQLGIPMAGVSLVDGSGLSAADRATCRALLAAIGLDRRPGLSTLLGGLPVAGVSGTLANLFRGTPLAGRLAAKGGYITGVTSLVGRLAEGGPRRFAFIANGNFNYTVGLGLAERIVGSVAGP